MKREGEDAARPRSAARDDDFTHARRRFGEPVVKGDVIEVPIVEEVLVKKAVVREILRIRKEEVIERRIVEADLRREDVVDVAGGESPPRGGEDPAERRGLDRGPPRI